MNATSPPAADAPATRASFVTSNACSCAPATRRHSAGATIQAESGDTFNSVTRQSWGVGNVDRHGSLRLPGVDFSTATGNLIATRLAGPYAGNIVRFRLDCPNGPVIAQLTTPATGSDWSTWRTAYTALTTSVSGVHDVYVEFDGSSNYSRCMNECWVNQTATCTDASSHGCGYGIGNFDWFSLGTSCPTATPHLVDGTCTAGFTVSVSTTTTGLHVPRGGSTSLPVTINCAEGFSGPVQLSLSSLPTNVTAATTTIACGASGSLGVSASSDANLGAFSASLVATGQGITRNTTVEGDVYSTANFTTTLGVGSTGLTVAQGTSVTVPVTATCSGGLSGPVSVVLSDLPTGVTASPATLDCGQTGSMVVAAAANASAGSFSAVLMGSSAGLTNSSSVSGTVTTTPPFALSVGSATISAHRGGTTQVPVTATCASGTTGPVQVSLSSLPSGVSATSVSIACGATANVAVSASSSATLGDFAANLVGTVGNVSMSTSVAGTVWATAPSVTVAVSATGGTLSVAQGGSTQLPVAVSCSGGLNGPVTVTATNLPSGVSSSSLSLACGASGSLTVSAGSAAAPGAFVGTVSATAGSVVNNAPFNGTLTCPSATPFVSGSACVASCPADAFTLGSTCVASCPSGMFANGSTCVAQCPVSTYVHGSTCVASCPSDTLTSGAACVTAAVTLTSSTDGTPAFGESVSFTAAIDLSNAGAVPAGVVTFASAAGVIGTATVGADGTATVTASCGLLPGTHSVTATYETTSGSYSAASGAAVMTFDRAQVDIVNLTFNNQASDYKAGLGYAFEGCALSYIPTVPVVSGTLSIYDGDTLVYQRVPPNSYPVNENTILPRRRIYTFTADFEGDDYLLPLTKVFTLDLRTFGNN